MRLIDADALIANIKSDFEGAAGLMASSGALFAVMALKSAPTLELDNLRPKGRWEPVDARYSRCTNCKKERNVRTQIAWAFCPSCGADMRGGDSDEAD